MIDAIKEYFGELYSRLTTHDSESILWSRAQLMFGSVWYALCNTDLSQFIQDPKLLAYWMFFNAMFSEYLRKRRDPNLEGE